MPVSPSAQAGPPSLPGLEQKVPGTDDSSVYEDYWSIGAPLTGRVHALCDSRFP